MKHPLEVLGGGKSTASMTRCRAAHLLKNALARALELKSSQTGETCAEALARLVVSWALNGQHWAVELIWDRVCGRPTEHVETGVPGAFDNTDENELRNAVLAEYKRRGVIEKFNEAGQAPVTAAGPSPQPVAPKKAKVPIVLDYSPKPPAILFCGLDQYMKTLEVPPKAAV